MVLVVAATAAAVALDTVVPRLLLVLLPECRYDPSLDIPVEIEEEEERVMFIRNCSHVMVWLPLALLFRHACLCGGV